MKNQKPNSISSNFFKAMALVSTTFILIFLIVTSLVFFRHFLNQESRSSLHHLDYISQQLEYFLQSTDNYSKSIMINSNVQKEVMKYNTQPDDFSGYDKLHINREINAIIQSTPIIHSISLYSPNLELISTTEIAHYRVGLENVPISDKAIWVNRNKYSNINKQEVISTFALIRPFYNYDTGDLLGYMEIALPESIVSNICQNKSTDYSHFFITNKYGIVQSSDSSIELGKKYANFKDGIEQYENSYKFIGNSIVFSRYFPLLDWYIINEISLLNFFKPFLNSFIFFIIITCLCVLACLYVSHKISRSITAPIYRLIDHTQKIREGDWSPVKEDYNDSDIGLLYEEFNRMIIAQEGLKNDLLESQKMKAKLSLDLLQQQVNPHFLYNTLDNICSLAELEENDMVIKLVMYLSTFYREALSSGKNRISIRNELAITRAYLNIMQIRYYNKLDFRITCQKDLLDCICLKLLLQPIVENSIYHGIKGLDRKGFIDINIYQEYNDIIFSIRDNGIGLSPDSYDKIWGEYNNHFGIKNTDKRIKLYYGEEYGLTIKNHFTGGCITKLKIAKKES